MKISDMDFDDIIENNLEELISNTKIPVDKFIEKELDIFYKKVDYLQEEDFLF